MVMVYGERCVQVWSVWHNTDVNLGENKSTGAQDSANVPSEESFACKLIFWLVSITAFLVAAFFFSGGR